MPSELDAILDDAEDTSLAAWKRVGVFEVLESPLGTAIIHTYERSTLGRAFIRYADHVCVDTGEGTSTDLRLACEKALRDRPKTLRTLDLEDDPPTVTPAPVTPKKEPLPPKPSREPRKWSTIPLQSAEDELGPPDDFFR